MNPPHTKQQETVTCAQINQQDMDTSPAQMQISAAYNHNSSLTSAPQGSKIVPTSLHQEQMGPITRISPSFIQQRSVVLRHPFPRRPPASVTETSTRRVPRSFSPISTHPRPNKTGVEKERGTYIHPSSSNQDQPPLLLTSSGNTHTSMTLNDEQQNRLLWHNIAPILPIIQPPSSPDLAYITERFPRIPTPTLEDDPIILEAIQISDRYLSEREHGSVIPKMGVHVDVRLNPVFIGFSAKAWKKSEALEKGADELVAVMQGIYEAA